MSAPLTAHQLAEMHARAHRHTRDCFDADNASLLLCARGEDSFLLIAEVDRLTAQRDGFALTILELSTLRDAGGASVSELARAHERLIAEVRAEAKRLNAIADLGGRRLVCVECGDNAELRQDDTVRCSLCWARRTAS